MWPALTAPGSGRERLEQALAGYCEAVEANLELAGRAGRGRPQRDLPRGGPARPDPAGPSPSRSAGCCRTAPPTARWPTRTPRRPPPCCSTSSAGPTATCAAATAGSPSAPATACCASRWTGWRRVERRARSPRSRGPRLRACVRRHGPGRDSRAAALPHRPARDLLRRRRRARPRHERRVVGHPAALRPGLRSPVAAVADAARRPARRAGHRARRASRRATRPPRPRWRSAASASRPSIPKGRASPTRSPATAAGRG